MYSLAFDTCLDKMYVAISEDDRILSSKVIETTKEHYHSAFLISTIRDILKEISIEPKDVSLIATNIGPGSFTGIRACMTVARVFAQAFDIKTIGVSSLEIISKINQYCKKTLVALDARKEMAYIAVYEGDNQVVEPQVMLIENLKKFIEKDDYFIITEDKLQPVLGGISYQQTDLDLGKFLIEIASLKLQNGVDTDWRKLRPLYIQPPSVNISSKK